jgi:hypothetical protein
LVSGYLAVDPGLVGWGVMMVNDFGDIVENFWTFGKIVWVDFEKVGFRVIMVV